MAVMIRRGIVILIFMVVGSTVFADDSALKDIESAQGVAWLQPCQEKVLGVEILCNHLWKQEVGHNSIVFTISEDPAVLLTVARSKEVFTGIEELTRERVQKLGDYTGDFHMETIKIGGHPAIKVEGYSRGFADVRLLDIYVLQNFRICSFLFSVSPQEDWGRFSVLFAQMIQSIRLTDAK